MWRGVLQVRGGAAVPSVGPMRCLLKGADDKSDSSERARYKIIDVSAGLQSNYTAADSAGRFLADSSQ